MMRRAPSGMHPRAGTRGVTLVELLVAMTIGLLITIVIAQLFLGSRQTFATTDDVSRMQDNIRFTQYILNRTIHVAGYKSQANSITGNVFSGGNAALEGTNNPAAQGSDTITVRYQGSRGAGGAADGSVVDCLGVAIDAGVMAVNTFSIGTGADGRPALFCNNGGVNAVEMAPNVANMQILFGEDTNSDLVADRYVPRTAPGMNVNNVVSVRIALLFETPTESAKTVPDATTYDMLGDGSVVLGPFNDRRIRRLVTTTINLRNRTP